MRVLYIQVGFLLYSDNFKLSIRCGVNLDNISNDTSYAKLIEKIKKNHSKMIKRPIYFILLLILGLPTMVIVLVKHVFKEKNNDYENLKKEIYDDFIKKGIRKKIYDECSEAHRKKLQFLNKNLSQSTFDNEVEKYAEQVFIELINDDLKKQSFEKNVNAEGVFDTYYDLLNSKLFFSISFITSIFMYMLIFVYSNPYLKYIFERLFMMVFVVFGVATLVFTILYISPSDPAKNILGQEATLEQIESFRAGYGLDKPYIVQLIRTFKKLITLDLGKSYVGNEDIAAAIARKFPITLQLSLASMAVAIIIAIPAGVISAIKQYSSFDYIFMLIALIGLSIPNFWLGLILILNFSIKLHWLPATYSATNWKTLIMPAIVLGTGLSASVARMTRSSMLEIKNQDYILTAKAKGLSERRVTIKHILGNAMIPIITVIGLQFGGIMGGAAVTEKVFNVNGLGSYIVDKQFIPDIPIVLSGVVYVAIVISIVNLMVDLLYAFLDPRIKSKMK